MKTIVSLLWLCWASGLHAASPADRDPSGSRFLTDTAVHLTVIKAGCALKFRAGDGIPPEASEAVFLVRGETETRIAGPSDLEGCMAIGSPEEALEYVRFYSSYRTVHLFADQIMEVFRTPGTERSDEPATLPQAVWEKYRLPTALAKKVSGGFRITRVVAVAVDGKPWNIRLKKLSQLVTKDGVVRELTRDDLDVPEAALEGLSLPMFL